MLKRRLWLLFFFSQLLFADSSSESSGGSGGSSPPYLIDLEVDDFYWEGSGTNTYDVTDDHNRKQVIDFKITYRPHNNRRLHYFVTCGKGGAQSASYDRKLYKGTDSLDYQIYINNATTKIFKEFPEASVNNDVINGRTPKGNSGSSKEIDKKFRVRIPKLQLVPAGTYTDSFTMRLYEGTVGGSSTEEDFINVNFTTDVAEMLELSILDPGESFDPAKSSYLADFGSFSTAASIFCDLRVRSNAGYSISLNSDNAGRMKRVSAFEAYFPYQFKLDNNLIDLSQGTIEIANATGLTSYNGDLFSIEIYADPVSSSVVAGSYRDDLTITVASVD